MTPLYLYIACMKPITLPELPIETQTYKSEVDRMGNQLIEDNWMTGLSIGLIHPSGIEFYNYGVQNTIDKTPVSKNSIFEIGSVTKVFNSTLLAELTVDSPITLEQPLQEWVLQDWNLPSQDDVQISALHLSTHTSGLPRLPMDFVPSNMENPYADFTEDLLQPSLAITELESTPGTSVQYSNLGAGLLGYALTQYTQQSYQELLQENITNPLKMNHTSIEVSEQNKGLIAQGHDFIGNPTSDWDMPALVGMGEINSTVSDLIRFLSVQLSPPEGTLGEAIALTQQSQFERPGGSIGLGWHIGIQDWPAPEIVEPTLIWHNGGTGGARSFVGFDTVNNVGFVVLNNNPSPYADALGLALYQMLLGKEFSLNLPELFPMNEEQLVEHQGNYEIAPGVIFNFTPNDNHLHVQVLEEPTFPAFPISESQFLAVHAGLIFEFVRNEEGTIYQMLMHQGENIIPAPKEGVEKPPKEAPTDTDTEVK